MTAGADAHYSGPIRQAQAVLLLVIYGHGTVKIDGHAMRRPMHFRGLCSPMIILAPLVLPSIAHASELRQDPGGVGGIPWGSALKTRPDMAAVDDGERIQSYERRNGPPVLNVGPLDSVRYIAIDGEFARVTVRYHGKATHDRVLTFLEEHYGPLDHTPGQMVRGLNQQFNWRGPETEINLTYEGLKEQGFLFFDSRRLAPRFNDTVTD